ncbi:hypothetical protein M2451_002883 [Dysgonomonas sp. PFB1-18]|uniref:PcfK-like family protein n=1 Tax=unclassified Dysgonomonas TaxID=2630389 RepID=UPI0013D2AEA1|nr:MULTISPECIES: PcfK-like family protein [unclassified Dysgonomonas]MDH6309993.1 hypothetical protein [Dysgonomonas sp. PF1-14]MDH6339902.1 hypothetical protein [Dysgonomonas sp. PF1-16]MDH6381550.1 hypothetical protein [Dysgonomonas sp. PFB1-18]MDH6398813.1 hypothetical protein [Dysgonomonas sp. PF1-23]NDV93657.1 PcfK-like protein [Dysgonomonas sp. 521]
MKSTTIFTRTILTYLEKRAETDALFAESFAKTDKNIDDCITYILNTVQKSGCAGFADIEIQSMAVHYYTEDTIEIGKPMDNCHITVNHVVELTEEEKEQARKDAIQKAQNDAYNKMMQPKKKTATKQTTEIKQLTLF